LCDSGGDDGRHWQRNAKVDPSTLPEVALDIPELPCQSDDVAVTVSLCHCLPRVLSLDDTCREYNALPCPDWDSGIYGVSKAGAKWLAARGLTAGDSWNSYNGDSTLSQTLQGTEMRETDGVETYILLQIHQGADVRGGYTDAKLFVSPEGCYLDTCPSVFATVTKPDGSTFGLANDSGSRLLLDGEPVEIPAGSTIEAWLNI